MKRFLLPLVVLLAALAGVWFWSAGDLGKITALFNRGESPAVIVPETVDQTAVPETTPQPQPATLSATENAADAAADAAEIAADAAAQATAAAPTSQAAREAQIAAEQAIAAADRAADAAAPVRQETPESIAALLTPEGYDPARVAALIDGSALSEDRKAVLKALLNSASVSPEQLRAALDQVRAAIQ